MRYPLHNKIKPAFTLAELLVVLAVLGVIATFSVPKILSAQQYSMNKALFKKTISEFSSELFVGLQQGDIKDNVDFNDYLSNRLGSIKDCNPPSGCGWTDATMPACSWGTHSGLGINMYQLNSGVWVFLDNFTDGDGFYVLGIDVNGTSGPNETGEDQISLSYCLSRQCLVNWSYWQPGIHLGKLFILEWNADGVNSRIAYNRIFSNQ